MADKYVSGDMFDLNSNWFFDSMPIRLRENLYLPSMLAQYYKASLL